MDVREAVSLPGWGLRGWKAGTQPGPLAVQADKLSAGHAPVFSLGQQCSDLLGRHGREHPGTLRADECVIAHVCIQMDKSSYSIGQYFFTLV